MNIISYCCFYSFLLAVEVNVVNYSVIIQSSEAHLVITAEVRKLLLLLLVAFIKRWILLVLSLIQFSSISVPYVTTTRAIIRVHFLMLLLMMME